MQKIRSLVLENGYSHKLLKRFLREVRLKRATKKRGKKRVNEDGYLTLPYIDERLLCKVKNVVKKSELKAPGLSP